MLVVFLLCNRYYARDDCSEIKDELIMSVTDCVILTMAPEYEKPWTLTRGREMFYDEERKQRRWHTWQEAIEWCEVNLGVSPLERLPEVARVQAEEKLKEPRQRRLL